MSSGNQRRRQAFAGAILAANLLPVALALFFVRRFGVDVPMWDEWDAMVLWMFRRHDRGKFTVSNLWTPQNEHRIFFSRLIAIVNATLFHWDRRVEMCVSVSLLAFAAVMFFRMARAYWGSPRAALFFIPVAWTMMSWRQYGNLLVGAQTQICLVVAGAIATFYLLRRASGLGTATWLAASAAFIASFSFAAGLFTWPVGLLQLFTRQKFAPPHERPRRRALVLWSAAGLATWAFYFYKYQPPDEPWPHGLLALLHNPLGAVLYGVVLIGSPFSFSMIPAAAFGLLVALLIVFTLVVLIRLPKEDLVAASSCLALLLYATLLSILVAYGRFGIGSQQALESRYTSLIVLGPLAAYVLLLKSAMNGRQASVVACGLLFGMQAFASVDGYLGWSYDPTAAQYREAIKLTQFIAWNSAIVNDGIILGVHPVPGNVRRGIQVVRRHGYSIFRDSAPPGLPARWLGSSQACALDGINASMQNPLEIHRSPQDALDIGGWAIDRAAGAPPERVAVSIDGTLDFPAFIGKSRADVAGALGNRHYLLSGIVAPLKLSLIPDGDHVIAWKIVNHDGTGYWTCNGGGVDRVIRVLK